MILRVYKPADCKALTELFYETVHSVNTKDYTKEQVDAWAPEDRDLTAWDQSFQGHFALVAVEGVTLLGFGDITPSGYLDRPYVHQDHLRQGSPQPSAKGWKAWSRGRLSPMPPTQPGLFLPGGGIVWSGPRRWSAGV